MHFRHCATGDDIYDTELPEPLPAGRKLCGVVGYVFAAPPASIVTEPITLYRSTTGEDHRTTIQPPPDGYAAVKVVGHSPQELSRRLGVPAPELPIDAGCCGQEEATPIASTGTTTLGSMGTTGVGAQPDDDQEEGPAMSGAKAFSEPPHGFECGSAHVDQGQTLWVVASGQRFKESQCTKMTLP